MDGEAPAVQMFGPPSGEEFLDEGGSEPFSNNQVDNHKWPPGLSLPPLVWRVSLDLRLSLLFLPQALISA